MNKVAAKPPESFVLTFTVDAPMTEDELCTRFARFVLAECKGNKSLAARCLGIDRRSLYRRLGLLDKRDMEPAPNEVEDALGA